MTMKLSRVFAMFIFAALTGTLSAHVGAQAKREAPQSPRADAPSSVKETAPVYRPPVRGTPGGRVGGGSRGTARAVFVLSVLAPDHTGLSMSDQPSLFWFISSTASSPVEVTVVDPRATKALVEIRLPTPVLAGVHAIHLADHGIRLEPGVAYRWYVAVVPDGNRRSKDVLAGGAIERVEPPEGLRARLAQAGKADAPSLYAEAGLWYDAVASISALIGAAPNDPALRRQRAALLAQVGLPAID
jgi:hypothetical protein